VSSERAEAELLALSDDSQAETESRSDEWEMETVRLNPSPYSSPSDVENVLPVVSEALPSMPISAPSIIREEIRELHDLLPRLDFIACRARAREILDMVGWDTISRIALPST